MHVSAALDRLLTETASVTGQEFFCAFARVFAEVLGARYGLIGKLVDHERVQVLALWQGSGFGTPFTYALHATPCEHAIREPVACTYPRGVAQTFPEDALLRDMGIESYYGVPVRSPTGEAIGVIVALHDQVSEAPKDLETILQTFAMRVAAEMERADREAETRQLMAALAESEARYRTFATQCLEGVWAIDAHGRTNFANTQMANMLGYTVDEMQGRSLFDFMDDRARDEAARHMARRRTGVSERHEFRFRHRSGRDVWTVLSTSPLHDEQGTFTGALAFAADVTEWRELERRVQQAQKLESVGLLAGGIAHDFNNLLVGILGNVGLAQREFPAQSRGASYLQRIETTALRAADLTRQLLAYAGKGTFVLKRVDLNVLIREMADLLMTVISKGAVLKLELSTEPLIVEADETQLRQVFLNLITNASDALGEGLGAITVSTAQLSHSGEEHMAEVLPRQGGYAVIKVRDTGSGMDAATMSNIFDPFFTTKFTGRGLGLAAVQGILRSHRGSIEVESEPGHGACFTVWLPRSEPGNVQPEPSKKSLPPASRSGLVLIVDDEPAVRSVAREVLESVGYRVLEASDGQDGLRQYRERSGEIVAVLLDRTMPGLSGDETMGVLRGMRPDVPVVLTSGYCASGPASVAVDSKTVGFLEKPWRREQLITALDQVIGRPAV